MRIELNIVDGIKVILLSILVTSCASTGGFNNGKLIMEYKSDKVSKIRFSHNKIMYERTIASW
jgi:hypothetical protein